MEASAPFGLMKFIYLNAVLTVPAAGILVLLASRKVKALRARPLRVLALLSLLLPPLGIYMSFIEPFRLRMETAAIPIPAARTGSRPVKIGVLADLQTDRVTGHERSAVLRLMALEPDVILLPGDVFQGKPEDFQRELPAMKDLLGRLAAPGGVFCVEGNTDVREELKRLLQGTAVKLLEDEIVQVTLGDRRIALGGLGLGFRSEASRRTIRELESRPDEEDIRILVAHFPEAVLQLSPRSRIDLVVAGHTHGGQVRIPFFGPPITLSGAPRHVAAGGLHDLDGRRIYVSRGVGFERGSAPRIRFLCPPEISLLTLETAGSAR